MTARRLLPAEQGCAIGVPFAAQANPRQLKQLQDGGADFFELRLDLARCATAAGAAALARSFEPHPLIATYRSRREGGQGRDETLAAQLLSAAAAHAAALDVELDGSGLLDALKPALDEHGCELVASAHFCEHMPKLEKLRQLIEHGQACNAHIVKIAAKVGSDDDINILLQLLAGHRNAQPRLAVMGMGEHALALRSRVLCAQAGSVFTFAHYDLATAPGQPGLAEVAAKLRLPPG